MNAKEKLFEMQDKKYRDFQSKLIPNVEDTKIIGVRVPDIRKISKTFDNVEMKKFLADLPHVYYDENILHGIFISNIKDYEQCIAEIEKFLPYIDNWAVCDIISPKIFKKNKDKLIEKIYEWINIEHTYTKRFALKMLMTHFLDEDFDPKYLDLPASIETDEYYLKMMIAWFYAESLVKRWDETIPYIESKKLDKWIHNKTIQKARESFRITIDKKDYLKSLKI